MSSTPTYAPSAWVFMMSQLAIKFARLTVSSKTPTALNRLTI